MCVSYRACARASVSRFEGTFASSNRESPPPRTKKRAEAPRRFRGHFFSEHCFISCDVFRFISVLSRTFPFGVVIHSTSYGSAPRPVCCAARAERGMMRRVRVGRSTRETSHLAICAVVPSRFGVSCATFQARVLVSKARTDGCSGANFWVSAHAASACRTDASASTARSSTTRFIVRVVARCSLCPVLSRTCGAKTHNHRLTTDAYRVEISEWNNCSNLHHEYSRSPESSQATRSVPARSRFCASWIPERHTPARATVSHAHLRPTTSSLSPSPSRFDKSRTRIHRHTRPCIRFSATEARAAEKSNTRASRKSRTATHVSPWKHGGPVGRDEAIHRTSGNARSTPRLALARDHDARIARIAPTATSRFSKCPTQDDEKHSDSFLLAFFLRLTCAKKDQVCRNDAEGEALDADDHAARAGHSPFGSDRDGAVSSA